MTEDALSIAVWLVKETNDTSTRVGLEVSMTFTGITPAGRMIGVIFVAVILVMLLFLYLRTKGNI